MKRHLNKEVPRAKATPALPEFLAQTAQLRERAHRDARGQFLIEGARNIELALQNNALQTLIYASPMTALSGRLVAKTRIRGIPHFVTDAATLQTLAQGEDPQGLIGIAARQTIDLAESGAQNGIWLVFESVRKPGNLGSMLRTAQAAGARGCIAVTREIGGDDVDFFHPATVRSSMGAFWQQTLVRASWDELFRFRARHRPFWLGTSLRNARDFRDLNYPRDLWLWLGDERSGLSPRALHACQQLAYIPVSENVDSLGVGVAAGVMLCQLPLRRAKGLVPNPQGLEH